MAIDTKNKRMATIGLVLPVPSMLPDSDGTIDISDRLHLLWLYSGIAAAFFAPLVKETSLPIRVTATIELPIRKTGTVELEL